MNICQVVTAGLNFVSVLAAIDGAGTGQKDSGATASATGKNRVAGTLLGPGISQPCFDVGGDSYDAILLPGECAFRVADVSGKGIGAALLMTTLQTELRALVRAESDLSRLAASHARVHAQDVELIGHAFFEELDRFRMGALAGGDTTYLVVGLA